jgi:hypothetical protein
MKYDFDEDDKILNKILINILKCLLLTIMGLGVIILSAAFLPGGGV